MYLRFSQQTLRILCAIVCIFAVSAALADTVFSYQGRVKVQGQPFEGIGYFKFSIVSNSGSETLWSYNGTGTDGSEPAGAGIDLAVVDGVFNALIGDPATQTHIPATVLNDTQQLKLRTWFSDGTHGFQQLNPDVKLINLTQSVSEIAGDSYLYVNAATGNDENSGLTAAKAKKTIQAAVDVVPGRLSGNLTIRIAEGVYPEQVQIYGIATQIGKSLILEGDTSWTTASAATPTVVITGSDAPEVTPVRSFGITARACDKLTVRGIHVRYAKTSGVRFENGNYEIVNCVASNNSGPGILAVNNAKLDARGCRASSNSIGIHLATRSDARIFECEALSNSGSGIFFQDGCLGSIHETLKSNNNGRHGVQCWVYSLVYFQPGLTGEIKNNGGAAVNLTYLAHAQNYNLTVGNGSVVATGNASGNLQEQYGGVKYW